MARCWWPDVDGLNFVDDVEAAGYQGEFGRSDIPSLNSCRRLSFLKQVILFATMSWP